MNRTLDFDIEDKDKRGKVTDFNNYHSKTMKFKENKEKKGEKNMHEFDKEIFQQFERRIDEKIENQYARVNDKIENLNAKIDSLPRMFEEKLEIALIRRAEQERKERKDDKKAIIGWSISGTSLIIAILGLLGKTFGWF